MVRIKAPTTIRTRSVGSSVRRSPDVEPIAASSDLGADVEIQVLAPFFRKARQRRFSRLPVAGQ